jgi:esterase/lipase superfamily enzyme
MRRSELIKAIENVLELIEDSRLEDAVITIFTTRTKKEDEALLGFGDLLQALNFFSLGVSKFTDQEKTVLEIGGKGKGNRLNHQSSKKVATETDSANPTRVC